MARSIPLKQILTKTGFNSPWIDLCHGLKAVESGY
jgi:hypothetical protein